MFPALELVTSVYHACVRLEKDGVVVYTDPLGIQHDQEDADLVIITHSHNDHFSFEDIEKVRKEDTTFIATQEAADLLEENGIHAEYIMVVGCESPTVYFEDGVAVTPVVAKNKNHPVDFGFGAVVELGGFFYYFSGDTDVLASDVRCDVLFVVCDGQYNMPQYETRVVEEVKAMDSMPGLVVPYHYGYLPGTQQNGKKLEAALSAAGIPAKLLY